MCYDYDKNVIRKELKRFKSQKYNLKDINIFLDIDNTLALFCQRGKDLEACEKAEELGYYEKLPIFSCVKDNLMYLTRLGANIWIISAYRPRSNGDPHSPVGEKDRWVSKHLPFIPKDHRIFIPNGTNKAEEMGKVCDLNTAIIIDDYGKNIEQAYEKGIIGIKKTYSNKRRPCPQIQSFDEIFKVLRKLKVQFPE